jgi:hypothetical protein
MISVENEDRVDYPDGLYELRDSTVRHLSRDREKVNSVAKRPILALALESGNSNCTDRRDRISDSKVLLQKVGRMCRWITP